MYGHSTNVFWAVAVEQSCPLGLWKLDAFRVHYSFLLAICFSEVLLLVAIALAPSHPTGLLHIALRCTSQIVRSTLMTALFFEFQQPSSAARSTALPRPFPGVCDHTTRS
jgi:hypothetical protein